MTQDQRIAQRLKWREEEHQKRENLQAELLADWGVPRDPFFEKLWETAWSLGHASGYEEVRTYFNYLAELYEVR